MEKIQIKNLIYPLIASILIFAIITIIYKVFSKPTKTSLLVGILVSLIYLISMKGNTSVALGDKHISDLSGNVCSVNINDLYNEFNILNRYNPMFILPQNILHPKKCSQLEYCYWHSATFSQFNDCNSLKKYNIKIESSNH